jgi:RsiW-degrading membrane proteinase PrsW (M82 family)
MTPELLVLAVAPSLAIFIIFYLRDKYDREPWRYLLATFLLGAVMVVPAGFIESVLFSWWGIDIFSPTNLLVQLLAMVFIVGIVEEGCKFLVVRGYAWGKQAFNEPYDGIMYTLMASLGFATIENILYVWQWGILVAWLRAFLSVPMHALTAVIMGYYIGKAKYENKPALSYTGLWIAILLHGTFNWFVGSQNVWLLAAAPVMIVYIWWVGIRASKMHAEDSPFKDKTS